MKLASKRPIRKKLIEPAAESCASRRGGRVAQTRINEREGWGEKLKQYENIVFFFFVPLETHNNNTWTTLHMTVMAIIAFNRFTWTIYCYVYIAHVVYDDMSSGE